MRSIFLSLLGLLLAVSCQNSQSLFLENQEDWIEQGDAQWEFLNGELTGKVKDEQVGYVITNQKFKNFQLELEFKPDDTINSGVFIRCNSYEMSADNCYEVNIWDLHPNQDFRTGSVVKKEKPMAKVETNNKWNTYKIKIENDHLQIWVNEILTIDMLDSTLTEGYIGLQASGTGAISFRNVKISSL